MIAKIFLVVALVVGAGLLLQAFRDAKREAMTLKAETRKSAETIAEMIIGAVEHSMLQGEGIQVKALISELVERAPEAEVKVYDKRGIEVFAPPPPPPPPEAIPQLVRDTMQSKTRLERGGIVGRPVPSEERCRECHDDDAELRGVLSIEIDPASCEAKREQTITHLVESGFIHIMTARKSILIDDYFAELMQRAPRLHGAAVYDDEAILSFGAEIDGLSEEAILAAGDSSGRRRVDVAMGQVDLVPLVMEDRCQACHDDPLGQLRGVLALAVEPGGGHGCDSRELESVIDTSLRYIMLSQLGRRIADFLDSAASTDAVRGLELFDNKGRRFWTTNHPAPPEDVAAVLRAGQPVARFLGHGQSERSVVIQPLVNREGCRRCHGSKEDMRGAVSVSLSTASAARMRQETLEQRAFFSAGTLLAILVLLVGLMQYFVLRPVKQIGDVADDVGRGRLDVAVIRASEQGDEVARLGHRFNHMVQGLRAKTQLEKFVSRGAAQAAEGADAAGVNRSGERRLATILFSDIRGFTAYSETVSPESVVAMLNRVLDAQARVVHEHGGDIDKFVGDELMAVFQGPDANTRAVQCAVAMVEAVHRSLVAGENFSVGVGIATGEVIYGAMGSEQRMDFTVIGDVVNTGARLCSAADGDEVLMTEAVRADLAAIENVEVEPHEPLTAKGKREPVVVFVARRVGPTS